MKDLNIVIPITKADESRHEIYGIMTAEEVDKSGECLDYEGAKPEIQKWSDEISRISKGKSKGNLRRQHNANDVVGKVIDIVFNDTAKQVECCAKVTDEKTFSDILSGVISGFSIGGSYLKTWIDENGVTKYIPRITELSVVDSPCVGNATIQFIKADGTTENLTLGRKKKMDKDEFLKALSDGDLKKAFSFSDICSKVRTAIFEKKRGSYEYFYVEEIYADCAIIRMEDSADYYRIPYTLDESGEVTLGEAEKVVMEWKSVTEKTAEKAAENDDLAKAEGEEMKTEPEVKEETKTEETVEKTVETEKVEPAEEVTKADEPKEEKKEEEKPSDDKGEEVEKADKAEKVDSFAACMKALDGELDDKGKESCSKLFHKMIEKGLNCACEKCAKAVEGEKAEKATTDTDLNKTVETKEPMQKFVSADELAKAMKVVEDLQKGYDALKSDNDALKKQVEKLENEPIAGGAMVATGTMALDKTIGGNVGNVPANNSRADVLKKMISETDSAMLKEAYSKELAQLEMKKVFG